MERISVSTGSPWEDKVGYCRAIRIGNVVEVAGTTSMKDGELVGKGDAYLQTVQILKTIEEALQKVDARLEDVVRTRIYVTDISKWEEVGRAHGEVFSSIKPVTSVVEVSGLVSPDMLVEIEAHAIIA